MTNKALEQKFGSKLSRLAYRYDIRTTFEALIDAILYNLIIKDDVGLRKNPISLFDKKDEVDDFKECMILVGEIMEANGNLHDAFGDLFMEHLSFGKNGQFFTPQPICDMISQMQIKETLNGQSVCDPTCGSGRMLLAAAKINPKLSFYGSDIDLLCCKMTVLNLALNSLKGEIVWGDPLMLRVNASFKIGTCFLTNLPFVYIENESNMFGRISEIKKEIDSSPKPQQLTLFSDE